MPRMVHPDAPEPFDTLTDDQADVLRRSGWTEDGDVPEGHAPDGTPRPKDSAAKADWVAYAVQQGADGDAAEAMTRGALIEAYGSV